MLLLEVNGITFEVKFLPYLYVDYTRFQNIALFLCYSWFMIIKYLCDFIVKLLGPIFFNFVTF